MKPTLCLFFRSVFLMYHVLFVHCFIDLYQAFFIFIVVVFVLFCFLDLYCAMFWLIYIVCIINGTVTRADMLSTEHLQFAHFCLRFSFTFTHPISARVAGARQMRPQPGKMWSRHCMFLFLNRSQTLSVYSQLCPVTNQISVISVRCCVMFDILSQILFTVWHLESDVV